MRDSGARRGHCDPFSRRGALLGASILWLTWTGIGTFLVHGVLSRAPVAALTAQLLISAGIAAVVGLAPALTAYLTRGNIRHRSG